MRSLAQNQPVRPITNPGWVNVYDLDVDFPLYMRSSWHRVATLVERFVVDAGEASLNRPTR